MSSAAVNASVASKTASTWLGPEFDLERGQGQAQTLRDAFDDPERLVAQVGTMFGQQVESWMDQRHVGHRSGRCRLSGIEVRARSRAVEAVDAGIRPRGRR
jgi:hypothetical protein